MDTNTVITTYFNILSGAQKDGLADLVDHDVTFEGPFFTAHGAAEFVQGLQQWINLKKSYTMMKQFIDGTQACALYEVHVVSPSGTEVTIPTADWIEVRAGKILNERVYFDAREWAKAMGKA